MMEKKKVFNFQTESKDRADLKFITRELKVESQAAALRLLISAAATNFRCKSETKKEGGS
jgi:hypothetical protein